MDNDTIPELYTIWNEAKEHIEQGNYDKAIEIYKYILIRYGDDDTAVEHANAYLGDIYITLRQLDLAENHLKKTIDCKPDNPSYHYLLGFTHSLQRQWDKAIAEFEVAVDKVPNDYEYLRGLGWAINCSGDKVKGLAYLQKSLELAPDNINTLTDLAVANLSSFKFHKARKYAEKALQIDPNSNMARNVLDNIKRFQKEHKRFKER